MTTTLRPEPGPVATTDLAATLWADVAPILRDVPEPLDAALHSLLRSVIPLMASAADGDDRWSEETATRIRAHVAKIADATTDVTPIVGMVSELTSRVLHVVMSGTGTRPAASPRTVSAAGSRLVAELLAGAHHTTARKHRGTLAKGRSQRAQELLRGIRTEAGDDYDLAPAYAVVAVHCGEPLDTAVLTGTFDQVAPDGALTALGPAGGFVLLPAGDEARAAQLARRAHAALPGRVWMAVSWRPRGEVVWGRQEAGKVLSLARAADHQPGVYLLADLLVEFAVAREPTVSDNLVRIIEPLLQHPALLETLKVLVATDGNRSQAAERLIIHRSTLDYRIQRIEQLTGLHPGSVRGINVLSAALTAQAVAAQTDRPGAPKPRAGGNS
ncbi:PucR family transcriptional regulator [Amycolatopsis tolypomycina]|uniref:PucR C-terminal helix-turn-helix domain-containing protein n=1 Tax=Amycolatopsis tolypomycina TaxID=208445 RepID=A0A1H4T1F1_9PSEU|nr:helix-turn-helix domain-containing protein [Amycolatopsis tolypomycina]SEC50303.1 PucR C-terminal helix-turn-helix domain-containing protein [Amycolatopsis tolypomycina]